MSALDRIAGNGGTFFCEVTTAHTGKTFSQLLINSDAVFTTLTITDDTGTTHNALLTADSWGQNLAARTVKQGSLLTAPEGSWFSALTMSSGDCIGVITRDK
jgi:hypothetical protein